MSEGRQALVSTRVPLDRATAPGSIESSCVTGICRCGSRSATNVRPAEFTLTWIRAERRLARHAREEAAMTERSAGTATMDLGMGAPAGLVGRRDELRTMLAAVDTGSGIRVVFLHGIAGIGKSTLLSALLTEATRTGQTVVSLDGRTVEPTEGGFVDTLGRAVGLPGAAFDVVMGRIQGWSSVLIAVDNAENLRLLDSWLRRTLVPALPTEARIVLTGREPPIAAWLTEPRLRGATRTVTLGPLPEAESLQLLAALGQDGDRAQALHRVVRGHPLAMRLASETLADHPHRIDEIRIHQVMDDLARLYLAGVDNPETRTALEATSVVRRVTRSVLNAMVPNVPVDCFEVLAQLPFVESRPDGLLVHETVREAIARHLHAVDPSTYRQYRWLAWRRLSAELRSAPAHELWRYTADMLYLIENPVVREAFFPSGAQPLAVEPAQSDAVEAFARMTSLHDGDEASSLMRHWWDRAPETFSVVRDRDDQIAGYFQLLTSRDLRTSDVIGDPVVDAWRDHLREAPVPRGQVVLGFRRWLDIEGGEAPGATQAASWLDVKRTYMALRPHLRRIYVVVRDAATYWPVVERLGFRLLPEYARTTTIDGVPYTSVMLDFGPRSVDGWLAGLVGAELGVSSWMLNEDSHEISVGAQRIGLTPLEFAVLDRLRRIPGRTVPRRELLMDVWGWDGASGSNVVDATVRRLRRKLEHGPIVETVRGAGYRLLEG